MLRWGNYFRLSDWVLNVITKILKISGPFLTEFRVRGRSKYRKLKKDVMVMALQKEERVLELRHLISNNSFSFLNTLFSLFCVMLAISYSVYSINIFTI